MRASQSAVYILVKLQPWVYCTFTLSFHQDARKLELVPSPFDIDHVFTVTFTANTSSRRPPIAMLPV
jgi:hypothetical protein